jgi:hypothetical protein
MAVNITVDKHTNFFPEKVLFVEFAGFTENSLIKLSYLCLET